MKAITVAVRVAPPTIGIGSQEPVAQELRRLIDGELAGVRDEQLLVALERLRGRLASSRSVGQQYDLRPAELTPTGSGLGQRHQSQSSRRAHERGRGPATQLTSMREPGRAGGRTVVRPHHPRVPRRNGAGHRDLAVRPLGIQRAVRAPTARHHSAPRGRLPTARRRPRALTVTIGQAPLEGK